MFPVDVLPANFFSITTVAIGGNLIRHSDGSYSVLFVQLDVAKEAVLKVNDINIKYLNIIFKWSRVIQHSRPFEDIFGVQDQIASGGSRFVGA
jgi:hypothetical protein